jgi:hypothetical protein
MFRLWRHLHGCADFFFITNTHKTSTFPKSGAMFASAPIHFLSTQTNGLLTCSKNMAPCSRVRRFIFSTATNGVLTFTSSGAMFAGAQILFLVHKPMEHWHCSSSGARFASAPIHLLVPFWGGYWHVSNSGAMFAGAPIHLFITKTDGVFTCSNSGAMFAVAPIHFWIEKPMGYLHVRVLASCSHHTRACHQSQQAPQHNLVYILMKGGYGYVVYD